MIVLAAILIATPAFSEDQFSFFDESFSVGGELRTRVESFSNFYSATGSSDIGDTRILQRSKFHLDLHPSEYWKAFVEVQDSRAFGSDLINRHAAPNGFEDDIDLFQAYVEFNKIADSPVSLKIGRQLLFYGKQRLVGHFLWSNTARSFDAVKANIAIDSLNGSIDFFAGQPVDHDWGNFNEILDNKNTLYGAYSVWKDIAFLDFLEAYYLLKDVDNVDTEVHTLGVRLGNTYDSGWDWEAEFAGQFGDYAGLDHQAFALSMNAGYTFDYAWSPRVGVGYNWSPGDGDATDGDHETFDNLFPTNHIHYGQMDFASWRNMHDIELEVSGKPMDKMTAKFELHNFILDESDSDAWYSAGGGVLRAGAAGADDYVGSEIDIVVSYVAADWLKIEAGYSHLFTGGFVEDTGDDDDADWGYLMTTITF
ncbi:alginate export family protein [bacterium]|nr:alginate export family protein [bacterium]